MSTLQINLKVQSILNFGVSSLAQCFLKKMGENSGIGKLGKRPNSTFFEELVSSHKNVQ